MRFIPNDRVRELIIIAQYAINHSAMPDKEYEDVIVVLEELLYLRDLLRNGKRPWWLK
jgi:hypothetical protein